MTFWSATSVLARQGLPPRSHKASVTELTAVEVVTIDAISPAALRARDGERKGASPLRYAEPHDLSLSPGGIGTWHELDDGGSLWRLRVHAPGATDLNFGFTRYRLPPGASLHVWSELAERYFEGPYTSADNKGHGQLWTPVIPGARGVIELFVPASPKFAPELELTRIGRGYRDLFRLQAVPESGACNNDVVCPLGDAWRPQIRSVGVYSEGGGLFCTGTMLNNTADDCAPYFLTADHCGIASSAPSMVVYWNYETSACGGPRDGPLTDNQTGATAVASRVDVDFALVRLDAMPDPAHLVYYSGWDMSGVPPPGSIGIHHPNTDEKAISWNDDPLYTVDSCIGGGGGTHWEVDDWEDGTTEPGSSGSGLWHPLNQRLVGQLSGGSAACPDLNGYDCYGQFAVDWNGNNPGERVRDWLDPLGIAVDGIDGRECSPQVVAPRYNSHSGSDACALNPGGTDGVWDPGEDVDVSVALNSIGTLTNAVGTLTTTTLDISILIDTATWPLLLPGIADTSATPFRIHIGSNVPCGTTIDFDLSVTSDQGGPHSLAFTAEVGSRRRITLLDRPGYPAEPFGCNDEDMRILFDDAAAIDPEGVCGNNPWFTGPGQPVDSLAALNGRPSDGDWSLWVTDHVGNDVGDVLQWQLLTVPPIAPVVGGPAPIPDGPGGVVQSQLAVGDSVVLSDVNVQVDIDHTYVGDLHILLESPALCTPCSGCGDSNTDPGEQCDEGGNTETCDADCTLPACGDGVFNDQAEPCDEGGNTPTCDVDCTLPACGDGVFNDQAEPCDEGGDTPTCDADCTLPACGDGVFNDQAEPCDEGGETATCDDDCTLVVCGDGNINEAANEECDPPGGGDCDANCQIVSCSVAAFAPLQGLRGVLTPAGDAEFSYQPDPASPPEYHLNSVRNSAQIPQANVPGSGGGGNTECTTATTTCTFTPPGSVMFLQVVSACDTDSEGPVF